MQIRNVALTDIEQIDPSELKPGRLDTLLHGAEPFDTVLHSRQDPITLDGPGPPYQVTDGRHRVYLARTQGRTHVLARCLWLEHPIMPAAVAMSDVPPVLGAPPHPSATSEDLDVTKDVRDAFTWFFRGSIYLVIAVSLLSLCAALALMAMTRAILF